jgi:hypothetical protein
MENCCFIQILRIKISTIFDVGCRSDILFLDFEGEVHYFDPDIKAIEKIKLVKNKNSKFFFNEFGLG